MAVQFALLNALALCGHVLLISPIAHTQLCDGAAAGVDSAGHTTLDARERAGASHNKETAPSVEGEHDLHLGNCDELSADFYDVIRCEEALFNDTIYTITQYRFPSPLMIYCVNVTDLVKDGTGGYPMRYEGGLYQSFIDISFMSQLSQGIKFNVQVYAKARA